MSLWEQANGYRTVRPVTVSYSELKSKERDFSEKIEEAFGPKGLGIISISDVPEFSLLRQNLLQLSPIVANHPDDVKVSLEDPDSRLGMEGKFVVRRLYGRVDEIFLRTSQHDVNTPNSDD